MRLQDVDLPDGLLQAQESGSLVIFAGAGVSIPAPSNYPNFGKLAEEVSSGALLRQDNEPVDRFLGRLVKHGVHVHELVRKILSDPKSLPNPLHINLLRLFKSASKAKIVTTNFDLHFTSAAQRVFQDFGQLEIHSAPALPLGHSFSGVVYLHGSVDKPDDRLVLTDADFGRAYLTEGWARRFLQTLFASKTVFFVGYSHSDPVMNYLARGLPPQTGLPNRFALTPEKDRERWEFLGVTPVTYPLGDAENKHSAVSSVIASWGNLVSMGMLDQEEHIRQIVEEPPASLSTENSDYILKALRDGSTARFFTRHAHHPEWLRWIEKAGFLRKLFGAYAVLEPAELELATWVAERFVCEHMGDALALIQRQGQSLGDALWLAIAFRLFRKKDPPPEPNVFSKWVPILLNSAAPGRTRDLLDYILGRLGSPENDTTAVLLFQYLTAPRVAMKEDIWGKINREHGEQSPQNVSVELTAEGEEYWLTENWHKIFRSRLPQFAEGLVPIITSHLQHAHLLLRSYEKVYEEWDQLNSHRDVIENAGSFRDFTDVLVDAGRDIMDLYVAKYPSRANALIEMWLCCECRLLKRLAIYGSGKYAGWDSDQKINWIIQNSLLYAHGLKHEVFLVLRSSYPGASKACRDVLLDEVEKGPLSKQETDLKARRIYDLLHWLHESDTDCPTVKERLKKIEAAHSEFRPREHADLDVVRGEATDVKEQSPVTAEELIRKPPEQQLDFLLSYNPQYSPGGPSRGELLRTLGVAAGKSFGWGMALARALELRGLSQSDLWPSIFATWNGQGLSDAEWTEILEFLQNKHFKLATRELAALLENGIRKSEHSIPIGCVQLAFQVSETLWKDVVGSEALREKSEDWLSLAINHPAGMLAEFWLHFTLRLRNAQGEKWFGIPEAQKALFDEVVSGETYDSELARIVFASQLHFFFSVDKSWALEKILPLLDPAKNSRWAFQCWHGYLGWGRWLEALLPDLLPLYEKMFPIIASESDSLQQRFCEHLAAIACFSSINPIEHGWLNRFLRIVEPELRRKWTAEILVMLKQLENPKKQEAWKNWIASYWQSRIQGIPIPLDGSESGEMAEWSLQLEPVFPEVVEKIISGPAPELERSFIYWELPETRLPQLYPTPVARLLLYLLLESTASIYDYDRIDRVVEQLISEKADRGLLLDICDALAKRGYAGASRLRKLIPPD